MGKPRVGLIIPAYNEEKTIGNVVNVVSLYGQAIVVDDASTDKTASIASSSGAIVVKHSVNLGYESSLESGFREASGMGIEIVVTLDADGQHNPKLVKKFIASIISGNDLVLGVRDSFPRISEALFALYSYHKFGIKDPMCGMKAYKIDSYKKVGYFDSCKLVGSELAFILVLDGGKFEQIPFLVEKREGKSKYGDAFSANVRILRALILTFFKFK
jgi:glycosyltransferase involved in cell wall biosynthesis